MSKHFQIVISRFVVNLFSFFHDKNFKSQRALEISRDVICRFGQFKKMFSLDTKIHRTLKDVGIQTRPNAGIGYWVSFLLPLCVILTLGRNATIVSFNYKLASLIATGFIVASIVIIVQCVKYNRLKIGIPHYVTAIYTSSLFYTCLHKGILFSLVSGFSTTFLYFKGLILLLQICPQSFTFGEAALAVQGTIFFLYMCVLNIYEAALQTPMKVSHISDVILQIGIAGLGIICLSVYKMKFLRKTVTFYILTISVLFLCIFLPLHVLLKQSPVIWMVHLMTDNLSTVKMMIFWTICCTMAVIAVRKQIQGGKKASTIVRKIFHILVLLVFLTGLIDQCHLIYLASGIVFAIFVALEMLRVLNLSPLGSYLQDGFTVFSDEKDAGSIALTPIYLLVGCSLPMWIHPGPCDVTNSAGFHLLPLISGILSVGMGDTMASIFGVLLGKHKWAGTKKTFEGTIACILGQMALVYVLIYLGYITNTNENIARASVAIVVSSLVEAKTDQVDNLVLPLVTYIILV